MARTALFLASLFVSAIALNCGSEAEDGLLPPPGGSSVKGPGGGGAGTTPGSPNGGGPSAEGPGLTLDASFTQDGGPGANVAEAGTTGKDGGPGTGIGTNDSGTVKTDSGGTGTSDSGDPCANVVCGTDEVCVPYAHNKPLGVCVSTCDCNNCGNCGGDNSDGRWDDMQEYCGNPGASPATMACTRPCNGGGCIPFGSTSICWPMQGCFSL